MQALAIIHPLDECADLGCCMSEIAIDVGIHLLLFEGLHEAFGHGAVIGAAGPAHAGLDIGRLDAGDVVATGILDAAIGMMNQTAADHLAAGQGHLQELR